MSAPDARAGALSRRIIEHEIAGREAPADVAAVIEGAFRRLHQVMSTVIGPLGFQAVVTRAVHLTRRACPGFDACHVTCGDTVVMTGMSELIERDGAAQAGAAAAVLLANVISLLCSFIGEDLTFRLLRRGWTGLPGEGERPGAEEA
ncbi:hypothetical protein [Sorangium cellulosum]|uniref:Uncharacterized protein n=1 Tax=Sorangium cellulosum TaxID=56 RepID=A0A150QWX0_SORCE|nr:hypothetical protein [Sorangium cellulosum]KYF72480.1 hypothetical protein BE15_17085 [Sorangium cellulosum]